MLKVLVEIDCRGPNLFFFKGLERSTTFTEKGEPDFCGKGPGRNQSFATWNEKDSTIFYQIAPAFTLSVKVCFSLEIFWQYGLKFNSSNIFFARA